MTQKLYLWIKSIIDTTPGMTQKGLAAAMGVNPAAVNRMLYGARKIKVDELPVIEAYLGQKYTPNDNPVPLPPYQEIYGSAQARSIAGDTTGLRPRSVDEMMPVYGVLNDEDPAEMNLNTDEPSDWVFRHPIVRGIRDAFAIYVINNEMQPRYYPGELAYIHPGRPPEVGKDCLIKFKDGRALLCRYLGRDNYYVHVQFYNPQKKQAIKHVEISGVYAVIGRG